MKASEKIIPRREILAFAVLMEIELRANDHKGGWKADKPFPLSYRVLEEAAELQRAAYLYHPPGSAFFDGRERANVASEAADVANMAMMVADVCQALPNGSFRTLGFDLAAFSIENRTRCEATDGFNHPLDKWTLSDWMIATADEIGEAANVVKKLNRYRDGIPGNDRSEAELRQDLADELADAFIYLDLTAQAAGLDLPKAIRDKFDRTSAKIGYIEELPF